MRLIAASALSFLLGAFLLSVVPASAAVTCPNPGERPATAADVPLMKAQGYPDDVAKEGNCWNPSSKEAGADPGQAKTYLRTILCPQDRDNYGGKGPDGTIQGLDGQFAVCAAKFLKAAKEQGIDVCIREGARSVEKQNEYVARGVLACKRGAQCEHPRGIAIDVNVRPNVNDCRSYARLHQSAPSFGVHFYLLCKDAYHFVPKPGGNCNGGGVIQPQRDYDFPQYYTPPTPTAGIANQFRQAFSPQPSFPAQPQLTTGPSQPFTPTTPPVQEPPPLLPEPKQTQFCVPEYKCSGNTLMYQNSFCTVQPVQACTNGCAAGACIIKAATSTSSTTQETTPTEKPRASSTLEMLEFMSGAESTIVEVGTSTPLQLLLALSEDQVSSTDLLATTSTSWRPIVGPSGNGVFVTAQQTFISSDLSQSVPQYQQPQPPAQTSTLFAVLEQLKQVLLWALSYLQPFEITRSRNITIDGHYTQ